MTNGKSATDRMDEIMRAVFRELIDRGDKAKGTDVLAAIAPKLNLTEHELALTKTGAVRWDTHVRFHTSDCVRAGFLQKNRGNWIITEAGKEALNLPEGELIREARRKYTEWKREQDESAEIDVDESAIDIEDDADDSTSDRSATYERALELAQSELEHAVHTFGPYEFQQLTEYLLEAMGYHVVFNAPPGKDGGVDLVAYSDPLGVTAPRIKCQVKHRKDKMTVKEVREMQGLLSRQGDVGILVSTGGFTGDAEREARAAHVQIELMDLTRFLELWDLYYDKASEEARAVLPLTRIAFLAPSVD